MKTVKVKCPANAFIHLKMSVALVLVSMCSL